MTSWISSLKGFPKNARPERERLHHVERRRPREGPDHRELRLRAGCLGREPPPRAASGRPPEHARTARRPASRRSARRAVRRGHGRLEHLPSSPAPASASPATIRVGDRYACRWMCPRSRRKVGCPIIPRGRKACRRLGREGAGASAGSPSSRASSWAGGGQSVVGDPRILTSGDLGWRCPRRGRLAPFGLATAAILSDVAAPSRTLRLRGTAYPVLLPSLRDPRLHLAGVIVSLQVLGQVAFDFRLSIAQILISIGTCAVLEVGDHLPAAARDHVARERDAHRQRRRVHPPGTRAPSTATGGACTGGGSSRGRRRSRCSRST